ncbi:hypothetical protein EXIGLDRAFT_616740, partial [Exidia glandulosa HHB12029]
DTDLIAAVSQLYFDTFPCVSRNPNANPMCGKTATVTYQGKSVTVGLYDRCVSCAFGDIDLTPAAFSAIADMNLGRIQGVTWQLGMRLHWPIQLKF